MTFDEEVNQLLEPVEAGKTLEPNRKKSADWSSGFQ
jgi:hypothetical protein